MQSYLGERGFSPGPLDGIFGPKTQAAVKRFQKAQGLVADGICGPKTWGKLLGGKQASTTPSRNDVDSFDAKVSNTGTGKASSQGQRIADAAAKVAGERRRYVWGGGHKGAPGASTGIANSKTVANDVSTKGYDCSGFVRQAVFQATGKDLMNGTAATQQKKSQPISKSELKEGDLIFFGRPVTHVAIYAGKINGVPMMYESAPSYEKKGSSYGTHLSPVSYQGTPSYYGRVR